MKRDTDAKPAEPARGELLPMVLGLMLLAGLAAVATRLLAPSGYWPWNLTPITQNVSTDPNAILFQALPCNDIDRLHTTSHVRSG